MYCGMSLDSCLHLSRIVYICHELMSGIVYICQIVLTFVENCKKVREIFTGVDIVCICLASAQIRSR